MKYFSENLKKYFISLGQSTKIRMICIIPSIKKLKHFILIELLNFILLTCAEIIYIYLVDAVFKSYLNGNQCSVF